MDKKEIARLGVLIDGMRNFSEKKEVLENWLSDADEHGMLSPANYAQKCDIIYSAMALSGSGGDVFAIFCDLIESAIDVWDKEIIHLEGFLQPNKEEKK